MITSDESLVSLEELRSVLIADQGPPHPVGRDRHRQRRWIWLGSRKRVLVAAAAVLVAAVAAGAALGGVQQVLDWFQGTPPTPAVQQEYTHWNAAADARNYALARANMAADAPTVDMKTVHGILALQLDTGPAYLWSGDVSDGGTCWLVQISDQSVGGEPASSNGCMTAAQLASSSVIEGISAPDGSLVMLGRAPNATTASLALSDGTTVTVPVVEDYFLASMPSGESAQDLTTYNAAGDQVASASVPDSVTTTTTRIGGGAG
jgi:hypothetical protein